MNASAHNWYCPLMTPPPTAVVHIFNECLKSSRLNVISRKISSFVSNLNCLHLFDISCISFPRNENIGFALPMVNTDLESLPWQWAPVEVHEDVSQAFHVVSPRLLDAQVRVDRGISEQEEGEDGGVMMMVVVVMMLMMALVEAYLSKTSQNFKWILLTRKREILVSEEKERVSRKEPIKASSGVLWPLWRR